MSKTISLFMIALMLFVCGLSMGSCSAGQTEKKIPIAVLILPKFEVGKMSGDFAGEAQYYYEGLLQGADEYDISGTGNNGILYVKDGIALFVTGMGKVDSALNTEAVLSDERFDFSDAYVISTGCSGSAAGRGICGDVYVGSACVDFDLGHHADPREMEDDSMPTLFKDNSLDSRIVVTLDTELTDKVYDLTKDIALDSTDKTRELLAKAFPDEEWYNRDPKVIRGTVVTGDNYWKGIYDHKNAEKIVESNKCRDPYVCSDMEEIAIAKLMENRGMLDRLIVLRDSVNIDVFLLEDTPERLWADEDGSPQGGDSSMEIDIFEVAMANNYRVGKAVIDAIMNGDL